MPAFADVRCNQPYAPEIRANGSMGKDDLRVMHDDTQTFIAASDLYQACLLKAVEKNASFSVQANRLIAVNQRDKERVGKAYNELLAELNRTKAGNIKTSAAGR